MSKESEVLGYLAASRKALQLEVSGCREEKGLLGGFGVGKVGAFRPQGLAG